MKKILTLSLLGLVLLVIIVMFLQIPTQAALTAALSQISSVAYYAYSYSSALSRPLFPEKSLFLPLISQAYLSCALVTVVLITSRYFQKSRHFVMLLTLFTTIRHLLWRAVETMDLSSPLSAFLTVLIYGAELLAFFAMILGYFQVWGQTEHQSVSLEGIPPEQLPSVDILVCTYNEPLRILYRSLVGCNSVDYPNKTVYLCDDGNRAEMRDLAEKLNIHYISREVNTHAKAGNLNHALSLTKGELVLVFDADHVPCQTFLKETVGFFRDEQLGFVQTPQHFFTADPFQRNLLAAEEINNEQDLFFHNIQPGNDYWGATFFAGSGALFRRNALLSVGGFAVETITEDVHTGMRLHGRKWKSIYYNRDLAAGMAQDSFFDFVKQRLRWARGMTQIFRLENPIFARGLSLPQRICYFSGIWYFFHGPARLIFMIAPLFFLLLGYKTINAGFIEVMIYYVPSFLATTLGGIIITRGIRHSFWSEIYETAFCFFISLITIQAFFIPHRASFQVTPKGSLNNMLKFNWRIVFPHAIIAALTILGIGMAIIRIFYTPQYIGGIYTNLFWAIYNLVLLLGAIYAAQERPQFRLYPRIFREIRCQLTLLDDSVAVGHTTNISEAGIAADFDAPVPIAGQLKLKLMDWELGEVSYLSVQAIRSIMDVKNHHKVGFQLVEQTEVQHQKMVRHMFGVDKTWEKGHVYTKAHQSFWNLMITPLRLFSAVEMPLRRISLRFKLVLDCIMHVENQHVTCLSNDISETGMSLVLTKPISLTMGQNIQIQIHWPTQEETALQALVKRVDPTHRNGLKIGLAFTELSQAQHLTLLQQMYQPKERLIRMAPSVNKRIACVIFSADDSTTPLVGMSQSISERDITIRSVSGTALQVGQKVEIQISWEDLSVKRYPAEVLDVKADQDAVILYLYFDGLNPEDLEQLGQHLHESAQGQIFQTLVRQ